MKQPDISKATLGRIPLYLNYLREISPYTENISATILAKELELGEVQVRKDLGSVSGAGRPKTGYRVEELIGALKAVLYTEKSEDTVLVGAGKLGRALLDYNGFLSYGMDITAAFDQAIQAEERSASGKPIYPMNHFSEFCKNKHVKIGIITVPASFAQEVCDQMLQNGVRAIWCFAPCILSVPPNFPVQYENMALSLAYLNKKII